MYGNCDEMIVLPWRNGIHAYWNKVRVLLLECLYWNAVVCCLCTIYPFVCLMTVARKIWGPNMKEKEKNV